MLKEIRFNKKPPFIANLEKNGGTNYKVYEMGALTVLDGLEPKGRKKKMIRHITVSSKNRYAASNSELSEIAKELLPKDMKYKIKKSIFMKSVIHIYEI